MEKASNQTSKEINIVNTDIGNKDGQTKCPKCGATDITLNPKTGKLFCNYCRCQFEPNKVEGFVEDITQLKGEVIGSGATDIVADSKDIITLKCTSCGAEVVINTTEHTQARCHWCRNTLSINQQIPNGTIPDMVLPFKLTKEQAQKSIDAYVKKRRFFANKIFKKEFTTENIMGVYLPYMLVDINGHANLKGQGEILVRQYTIGSGEDAETFYDADAYKVEREFDIFVTDLTIESNKEKLNHNSTDKTNNIINAIMPFDTENCIKWNANYLRGFSSERRDVNIDDLRNNITIQAKDIARFQANTELKQYNRGVRWEYEQLDIKGQQWSAAYLPVWLYSYQEKKGKSSMIHYVAVNARTNETIGSIPINMMKLIFYTVIIEIAGLIAMINTSDSDYSFIFLLPGIFFFIYMYARYRNKDARHKHEEETNSKIANIRKFDQFIEKRKRLRNSRIEGANNLNVSNASMNDILNKITKQKKQ